MDGNGPGLNTLIFPVCKSSALAVNATDTNPNNDNLNFTTNIFIKLNEP